MSAFDNTNKKRNKRKKEKKNKKSRNPDSVL